MVRKKKITRNEIRKTKRFVDSTIKRFGRTRAKKILREIMKSDPRFAATVVGGLIVGSFVAFPAVLLLSALAGVVSAVKFKQILDATRSTKRRRTSKKRKIVKRR